MTTKRRPTILDRAADYVEDYIRSMKWQPDTSDYIKTLVVCNMRGYAGDIRNKAFLKKTTSQT